MVVRIIIFSSNQITVALKEPHTLRLLTRPSSPSPTLVRRGIHLLPRDSAFLTGGLDTLLEVVLRLAVLWRPRSHLHGHVHPVAPHVFGEGRNGPEHAERRQSEMGMSSMFC